VTARPLYVLPLLFLGAAAAPSDCGGSVNAVGTGSVAPSVSVGRGREGETSVTDGYAAIHLPADAPGCDSRLPAVGNPGTLRNNTDDVLHGLPSSDSLAPINQQRQAPLYR
jgi:hypothetical protein